MPIAIATQNIWGRVPLWTLRKRALASALRGADIALFQEVQARGDSSQAHQLAGAMNLPYTLFVSAGRTLWWREGIALISRWPILHSAWEKFEQSRTNLIDRAAPRAILRAILQTPIGTLEIYAMHLSLSKKARTRAANAIATFAQHQRQSNPADFSIFAGDLNADPHESCLRTIRERCGVHDAHESHPTFPALWPRRRIDYLLLSPNLRATRIEHRTSIASDHCGLLAHIECTESSLISASPH